MKLEQRIEAFTQLGKHLAELSEEGFHNLAESARMENPWFTEESVKLAINGVVRFLQEDTLQKWISNYNLEPDHISSVGIVMAGNIPLVGFHDLLSVLISGHGAHVKLSSKDSKLIKYLIKHLLWLEPKFQELITIQDQLKNFDAVIATGSDNTARYFEYYFGKYPNIIRKNRTSCAILTGNETTEELTRLQDDVFMYFGLGCRNVSKIYLPAGYNPVTLLDAWTNYKTIIHHHKYCNNYDYQRSILLVNKVPFLDTGFVVVQENEKLVSPISVVYYEYYNSAEELSEKLQGIQDKIQCIVGNTENASTKFGQAQSPEVWDYADQIDTLKFLSELT